MIIIKKFLFIFFILLISCVNRGEKFQNLIEPKKDEAVIYFYRPSISGKMVKYNIRDERNLLITTMYSKSYYPYTTKNLGNREFSSALQGYGKISFNVEAGKTYFIKTKLGLHFSIYDLFTNKPVFGNKPIFELVKDEEKALKNLKKCKISLD